MDWDKLKTFHACAETGSLSAAGNDLGLSQSAVSRQIAALEDDVGVPLFHRHARGLTQTEAGRMLHEATRQMAATAKIAASNLADIRDVPQGELRVTAPVAFGSTWLAPKLANFLTSFPLVRLQLLLDDREYNLSNLEAEVAIRLWPAHQAELVQKRLTVVRTSIYAARSYLEGKAPILEIDDLDQHAIIGYGAASPSPMSGVDWVTLVGRDGKKPRMPAVRINNVYGMLKAVEAGLGVASLPDYMASGVPGLVKILPKLDGPSFDVYFIYPADLRKSKRIAAFRQFLTDQVAAWPI